MDNTLYGFFSYALAMLLYSQINFIGFIGIILIIVLLILGTYKLSNFFADAINILKGIYIFLKNTFS